MKLIDSLKVQKWLVERMTSSVELSLSRLGALEDLIRLVVLPDVHPTAEMCNGVVLATSRRIYPSAVGKDIGCGMLAARFDASGELLRDAHAAMRLLLELAHQIPPLKHPSNSAPLKLPESLMELSLSHPTLEKRKERDARWQLGTLGRGNHFIEFQVDDANQLWILIHSGSRGMGDAISAFHRRVELRFSENRSATHSDRVSTHLLGLDGKSSCGIAYRQDHNWARLYAKANRQAILNTVRAIMRELFQVEIVEDSVSDSDHNHLERDVWQDSEVWIHRKGAQSAQAGEFVVIPGSMGTFTCHAEGRGNIDSLSSCSHGAGRRLSRKEAAQCISLRKFRQEMSHVWFDQKQCLSLREEAPSAYRDLREVLQAQCSLIKIVRKLWPVLSYKG